MLGDLGRFLWRQRLEAGDQIHGKAAPFVEQLLQRVRLPAQERDELFSLGTFDLEGRRVPLLLTEAEAHRHAFIVGSTGTGKTYLELSLAREFVQRGSSVVALSPHPDLGAGVLQIAAECNVPAVHFDLSGRSDVVTPFDFLAANGMRADEIAHLGQSLFASAFQGATTPAGHVRQALGPLFWLLAEFDLTLLDCERLVTDPAFASGYLSRVDTLLPHVNTFFASLRGKSRNAALQASKHALARINSLLSFAGARNSLCARPAVSLRDALREQVVIVVSIPTATLGDAAGLLAGLVLESIRLALMQRPVPCREPRVVLFLDEFGAIAASSRKLGDFLAQSRKWRASAVFAVQSLSQIARQDLLAATMTNCSTFLISRVGAQDARHFAGDLPAILKPELSYEDAGWDPESGQAERQSRSEEKTRLFDSLMQCPNRHFHAYTSIGDLSPQVLRVRTNDFQIEGSPRGPVLLGAIPLAVAEEQVARRLREHSQALQQAPSPLTRPSRRRSATVLQSPTATPASSSLPLHKRDSSSTSSAPPTTTKGKRKPRYTVIKGPEEDS